MSSHVVYDIEVFSEYGEGYWAQEKYLVHGDDVFWTSDLELALNFLRESVERLNG